jgi:hypothetical protein
MPGPFTHIAICEAAMNRDDLGEELTKLLNYNYQFVFLGAESPDLPYLSILVGGKDWADAMHYERTNSQVISGFEALRKIWPLKTPADEIKCAWLLGYVSHMVADATVHPIVQAIVGPYNESVENQHNHRICEMTMDSLVFEEINHSELTFARFSKALDFCQESEHFPELLDFWEAQLGSNYPGMDHDSEPHTWFKEYTEALGLVEGGKLAAVFRHLGGMGDYFYRNPEDIRTDTPEDYQKYYAEVKYPGGSGPFLTNGFGPAVTNVVNIWKMLYTGLTGFGLAVSQVVINWNLDTGVDQVDGGVTFWPIMVY